MRRKKNLTIKFTRNLSQQTCDVPLCVRMEKQFGLLYGEESDGRFSSIPQAQFQDADDNRTLRACAGQAEVLGSSPVADRDRQVTQQLKRIAFFGELKSKIIDVCSRLRHRLQRVRLILQYAS